MVANTLGWSGLFAVEVFANKSLPLVNRVAGQFLSRIAGYEVASSVGATLMGGAIAGVITGIALAVALGDRGESREGAPGVIPEPGEHR